MKSYQIQKKGDLMNMNDFACGLAVGFLLAFLGYMMFFLFWIVEGGGKSD